MEEACADKVAAAMAQARRIEAEARERMSQLEASQRKHFDSVDTAADCATQESGQLDSKHPRLVEQQELTRQKADARAAAAQQAQAALSVTNQHAFGNSVVGTMVHPHNPQFPQPPHHPQPDGVGVNAVHGIGGGNMFAALYGAGGAGGAPPSQAPPSQHPELVGGVGAAVAAAAAAGGGGVRSSVELGVVGGGGGEPSDKRLDAFLSASKACVRADGNRCGRLEAARMLSLCARFGLVVPPDMAAAAKRKGMCSYTIFIDRLREVSAMGGS